MTDKDKVGSIEYPSVEHQNNLGIFDVDEYVKFENSVINNLDKFNKFKKFGRYSDKKIFDAINSNKPLTDMQKLAISNLLYEYKYFRAYFETVQESVRLFGNVEGALKDVLGKSLMHLRDHLSLWRFLGERVRRYLSGIHQTDKSRSELAKIIESMDANSRKSYKSKNKANGRDVFKIVEYYNAMINHEVEYGKGGKVSSKSKILFLEAIKERYKFKSMDAVKKCLQRQGVKGLPRL